jgi:hypothetical protein
MLKRVAYLLIVFGVVFGILAPASPAFAYAEGNKVSAVDAGEAYAALKYVSGTISAVSSSSITVSYRNGKASITLALSSSTPVRSGKETKTVADLVAGNRVTVKYNPTTLVALQIFKYR